MKLNSTKLFIQIALNLVIILIQNDRKMVLNTTRKPALREGNNDYDHLNDNFHAKTTDDGTYDHAEYQSRTNIHHQTDPFNGGYA